MKAPEYLCPVGQKEWSRILKELESAGVVQDLDSTALALYCDTFATYVGASKVVKAEGAVMVTQSGYTQISPYYTIMNNSLKSLQKMLTEFGLTPASRGKIKPGATGDDGFEELVNG